LPSVKPGKTYQNMAESQSDNSAAGFLTEVAENRWLARRVSGGVADF
jgi:hypothetical protein